MGNSGALEKSEERESILSLLRLPFRHIAPPPQIRCLQFHVEFRSANALHRVKNWEIIADNLSKAGRSWGCVSALDCEGRTIRIVDAHRDDGKRFVVHADEKLTAFAELEAAWATLYDPLTGAAEGTGPLLISRYAHSATLLQNGQVLVAGGEEINSPGSALLSEAELYTP